MQTVGAANDEFIYGTGDIDAVQSGQNQCCTETGGGIRTGTIRLLTRSAPVWRARNFTSSLGLPKAGDDYHVKVLVSEYIPIGHYAVQDGRSARGWQYYSAPEWFVQGLQEYDAIFHSTDSNGTMTRQRLFLDQGQRVEVYVLFAEPHDHRSVQWRCSTHGISCHDVRRRDPCSTSAEFREHV
jgi:hypothetical protein